MCGIAVCALVKTLQGRGRDSQSQPISGVRGEVKGNPIWGKKNQSQGVESLNLKQRCQSEIEIPLSKQERDSGKEIP